MSVSGTMASTLGAVNPLRYRGYVYDTETGLYYLSSRYYNPTWGRFVNADGYASTGQGFTGDNMFAYCNDNPVGYSDQNGEFSIVVGPAVALGTVVGLTSGIGMLIYAKRSDGNAVAGFFSGFIGGFFSGFTSVQLLTAGICNPRIMGLLRPISTAITSIAYELFATETLKNIDWELLLLDMSIDMLVSLMYPSIAQLEGESQIVLTSGYDIAVDIMQTELLYPNLPKQAPNSKLRNHKSVYRGGQSSGYGRRIGGVIPSVY